MAAARTTIIRSILVLAALGIAVGGGWTAYMWHVYWNHSGWTRTEKDEAFQATRAVSITPLRDNLYMLEGDGGNVTALIGGDGILIVDTDHDWMAPKIDAALKTLSDQPVRYVINTHFHGDHSGGNSHFRQAHGAEIIAHSKTLEHINPDFPDDLRVYAARSFDNIVESVT